MFFARESSVLIRVLSAVAALVIVAIAGGATEVFVQRPFTVGDGAVEAAGRAEPRARPQSGPKIYISVDMEGLAGVVTAEQLGPTGFEYQRFRRFMTEETLAAIEGARAAGAGEILVSDSHGNGQNLLLEMFPDDIEIVRSWPRPLMMMEGIDESFCLKRA